MLYRTESVDSNNGVLIEFLLEQGASCQIKNRFGDTPLTSAARESSDDAVEVILKFLTPKEDMADVLNAPNVTLFTPLKFAAANVHSSEDGAKALRIFKMLIDAGADINQLSSSGTSAVQVSNFFKKSRRRRKKKRPAIIRRITRPLGDVQRTRSILF